MSSSPASAEQLAASLADHGYIASDQIAMVLWLAIQMQKPILVEGPPGVGKTELAKAAADALAQPLLRLQCYEGLDESKALYEWKYGKQLLYTQVLKEQLGEILDGATDLASSVTRLHQFGDIFFSEEFLEPRPLLQALKSTSGCVLLIDEIDKSDYEFESLLLEILADYQVSVPEIGTVKAGINPIVVLTSNDTRELSDALKRRCLHLYIPYPDLELEQQIVASRLPELSTTLRNDLVRFIHSIRELDLKKAPAVSETLDWARTLVLLHADSLDEDTVRQTLNVVLKNTEDYQTVTSELPSLLKLA